MLNWIQMPGEKKAFWCVCEANLMEKCADISQQMSTTDAIIEKALSHVSTNCSSTNDQGMCGAGEAGEENCPIIVYGKAPQFLTPEEDTCIFLHVMRTFSGVSGWGGWFCLTFCFCTTHPWNDCTWKRTFSHVFREMVSFLGEERWLSMHVDSKPQKASKVNITPWIVLVWLGEFLQGEMI